MIYKADGGPHKVLSRQQLLFLQDQEAQSDPGRALVIIPLEAKHKGDPPTTYVSSLKPLATSSPLGRGDQPFDRFPSPVG